MPVSRFAPLTDIPERTYRRRLARLIADVDALTVEVSWFRQIYDTIRLHQALGDRTPRSTYLLEEDGTTQRRSGVGECDDAV